MVLTDLLPPCDRLHHHTYPNIPYPVSTSGNYLQAVVAQHSTNSTLFNSPHNQPLWNLRRPNSCLSSSHCKTVTSAIENKVNDDSYTSPPRIPASKSTNPRYHLCWSQTMRVYLEEIHSLLPSNHTANVLT